MEFPQILVINLAERTDRWAHIQQEFKSWDTPMHRIDACKHTIGRIGCTQSHKKAVQYAKDRDLPWVLIVEDDCKLEAGALKRFTDLLPSLWNQRSKWDIFLGGVICIDKQKCRVIQKTPPLIQGGGYATHFTFIHKDVYDKVLNMEVTYAINVSYRDKLRLWVTYPHLATQLSGKSDILDKHVQYDNLFEKSNTILRNLLYTGKTRKHGKHGKTRKIKKH